MAKRNKKHEKRIKKLIVVCMLSAIILTVSTYAWFIGMRTVSVNAFEVEIAAADGLLLSVDGKTFQETVTINGEEGDKTTEGTIAYIKENYPTNTNNWTNLKPVSTIGEMNNASNGSRMIIYEKSSLTATGGGYRLLSEQLVNKDDTSTGDVEAEADGYVVFDLFVKNMSGEAYYTGNNTENEEAIYLTLDSSVQVGNAGVENTGIENSVRVAFAQIGRTKAPENNTATEAEAKLIQGIDCAGTASGVTGICRTAQIWEPNDKNHVANAISWYDKSCKARTIVTTEGSEKDEYSGSCNTITDNAYYETYAVSKVIPEGLEFPVDVYDGEDYNKSTYSVDTAEYLNAVNTFTDTEKTYSGTSREAFMTLAPNSVTKVRVYIYIEGQDIDNYDFASLGKQISVNFGFTKERFTAEDVAYEENPNVDLNDDLYGYYHIKYENTGAVSGLPANVKFDDTTDTLSIQKSIMKNFTFTDGEGESEKTVNVTRTITEDGFVNWEAKAAEGE